MKDLNLEFIVLETDSNGIPVVSVNDTTIIVNDNDHVITTRPLTSIEAMLVESLRIAKEREIKCNINEPYFVLLGRDPQAPDLVNKWLVEREQMEGKTNKVLSAKQIANEMKVYKENNPHVGLLQTFYDALRWKCRF